MTPDEARERFSAAWDGELAAEDKAAFDAALAADPALAAEYEEFSQLLREAHAMAEDDDEEVPDLLGGVQNRIRARSRGRFYRDRFATESRARSTLPIMLGIVMLVIVAIAWLTIHVVQVDAPRVGRQRGTTETER